MPRSCYPVPVKYQPGKVDNPEWKQVTPAAVADFVTNAAVLHRKLDTPLLHHQPAASADLIF